MIFRRLRWALLCVAATYGMLLAIAAGASERVVTVGPGDSIDSLARRYRVSWKDIARANNISRDTLLRDGRRLIIPSPPKRVKRPATMNRPASINGNRISVRMGPYEGYRRVTLLDHGARVTVTRQAGNWYQVDLEDGRSGWIRSDFLEVSSRQSSASARRSERSRAASSERSSGESRKTASKSRRSRESEREARASTRKRTRTASGSARRTRSASSVRPRYARSTEYTRRRSRSEAQAPEAASDVIRTAYAYRGVRYRYGGSSRSGFDCSGFTSFVYQRNGISLPHNAAAQFSRGQRVSPSERKPGDLVFFSTTRRGISHVGIYVGDGKFVHASSGGGRVRVDSLTSGYYAKRYRGTRRIR